MDDPLPQSPYKTLNVPKDATLATIRSAHRKLVLSCHPDKVQDPAEKTVKAEQFHQVQQAYEILSDEKRRQRFDEKVKLEELRAEMEEDRRPAPRRTPDYTPRPAPPTRYTTYGDQMYETVPKYSSRAHEEDIFAARFAEERPSSGKFDIYDMPPSRKTSGRGPDYRSKQREVEEVRERDRDIRLREKDIYDREQRNRRRDKDRKRETEAKMRSKYAHVDEDDDSDSELDDRHYKSRREPPPKARYEEVRRGSRDEVPRKNSKGEERGYDDELMTKEMNVQEYISRSREAIDAEPRHTEPRRPTRTRTNSTAAVMTSPPPPPAPVDSAKRTSGRGGRVGRDSRNPSPPRSFKKDKHMPEIVESPSPSSRKPSMPKASSESKGFGIKGIFSPSSSSSRRPPQRAATYQTAPEFKPRPMRRSETMPVDQMRKGATKPLHTSNLKNMKAPSEYSSDSDSDSDSIMTEEPIPIRPHSRQNKINYRYVQDEEKLVQEPQERYPPRKSDESPRVRHGSNRPPMAARGATTRPSTMTTPRSASHALPQDERSSRPMPSRTESARIPPLSKHQSTRGSPRLYGEYPPRGEYSSDERNYTSRVSPKMYADDDRHNKSYSPRDSPEVDRDAWPGSFKPRQSRPHMSRGETAAY